MTNKRGFPNKVFFLKLVIQIAMTLLIVLMIVPLFTVVNYSLKTKRELYVDDPLSLPKTPHWENYATALDRLDIGTTFLNTVMYTTVSVTVLVFLSGASAWAIARNRGKFFRVSYVYFLVGILIPYQALFLPIYVIGFSLHLTNTVFGVVFMYVATGISFSVFIMTSFMSQVPRELEEAAYLDGCSVFRTYFSIVMPLLQPAIATLIIMQSFLIWNDYLMASLFVSDAKLKTLNVMFQQMFSQMTSDYTSAMAAIVITSVPVVTLFILMQKYIVKGIMQGGIKG